MPPRRAHTVPVHPHVRGEYLLRFHVKNSMGGSSPRAWGIPCVWRRAFVLARFIPTCVGNTLEAIKNVIFLPVHPHVRGEYIKLSIMSLKSSGSSPRAWGILSLPGKEGSIGRFIPTCVGNTPRTAQASLPQPGSSPRAWGIRERKDNHLLDCRFIPTCVGNTLLSKNLRACPAVHPHVRGEYTIGATRRKREVRFIPTCVGNTRAPARRA